MSKQLRALIVEDSADDALLIVRELKRGGYDASYERVDTAAGMSIALSEREWDVILADHSMPYFSAPAALCLMKKRGLDLPFIIISGALGQDNAVEAIKAGAHDYLTKDNLKRLAPAVERELKEATARRRQDEMEKELVGYRRRLEELVAERTAEQEIKAAHAKLESKALERTADLSKANEELSAEIAERKRVEQEIIQYHKRLRSLALESLLAEERERKRISLELHDRIGQPLLALKLMIGALRGFTHSADTAKALDEIDGLIGVTIDDARTLTFELSPHVLYMLGFEAAIEWLAEKSEKRYGVSFRYESDHKPKPMDEDLKVFLFQAIRELMTNVGKHARAASARVTVRRNEGTMSIEVDDDGVGFDVFEMDSIKGGNAGFGLFSIRERMRHLGGSFEITSKSGEGTRIRLTAPIKAVSDAGRREAPTRLSHSHHTI